MSTYDYETGDFGAEVTQRGYASGRGFTTGASLGHTIASAHTRYGDLGLRRFWRGRPSLSGIDSSFSRNTPTSPGIIEGAGPMKAPFATVRKMWKEADAQRVRKVGPTPASTSPWEEEASPAGALGPGRAGAVPAGTTQWEGTGGFPGSSTGGDSNYNLTNVRNRAVPGVSVQPWGAGSPSTGTMWSSGSSQDAIGGQPAIGGPYPNAIDTTSSG